MSSPITAAHPAVATIVAAITGVMTGALADVKVLDGIDPIQAYMARSVTIGGTWDSDAQAFATDQTIQVVSEERGAGRRVQELVAVQGIAYAGSGERDFAVHRADVGAMLVAIGNALRAITAVDNVSARVRISEQAWAQGADDKGAFVMAPFTIVASLLP